MTLQMSTENSKQDSKKKLYDVNDVTLFLIVRYSSIEGR